MSRELKRIRSTICGDLTDRSTETNENTQSWNSLPLEIAEQLYRFLPMNDKYNMSVTSKFWASVFRYPGTWRFTNCKFSRNFSERRQIPHDILLSLQHVTIDCSVPINTERKLKIDRLREFIIGLHVSKNTTLKTLDIVYMKDLGTHLEISELILDLSTILSEQTKLSRLTLRNARLHLAHGLELLTAAGLNSPKCLKYVNLQNFCNITNPVEYDLVFAVIMRKFTNLSELSLNCGFMSDDLLSHLSGTLKLIIVWVHWYDVAWYQLYPTYTFDGWDLLVSKCTGLKAEYHVDNLEGHMEIGPSLVLLPAVPLATFHWFTRGGRQSLIRPCFDEIINTFKMSHFADLEIIAYRACTKRSEGRRGQGGSTTSWKDSIRETLQQSSSSCATPAVNGLEHLHVDFGCQIMSERDVVAVVERCPLLQTFTINGKLVPLREATAPVENIVV